MKPVWMIVFLGLIFLVPLASAGDVASSEASGELGVGTGTHSDVAFSDATGELGVGAEDDDDDQGENVRVLIDQLEEPNHGLALIFVIAIAIASVSFAIALAVSFRAMRRVL